MGKHLVIGAASNYSWNELKYWVNSLKSTGYSGDIALACTNITNETIIKLASKNVLLFLYGNKTDEGFFSDSKLAPHVERFIQLWDLLEKLDQDGQTYENITVTDTRDVIFQDTPEKIDDLNVPIVVTGEGLKYEDEPWGKKNYHDTFGPVLYEKMKNNEILNVGVISGQYGYVKDLLFHIFQLSLNKPIAIVDQAVFNFLMYTYPYKDITKKMEIGINLGTTIHALSSGSGDIGQQYLNNPALAAKYKNDYLYLQPSINDDGEVSVCCENPYIVHQYDRVPFLKKIIEEKFGND